MTVWSWVTPILFFLQISPCCASEATDTWDSIFDKRIRAAFAPSLVKTSLIPFLDTPLETIVFKKQTNYQPYPSILCQIYKDLGFKGFYKGFLAKVMGTFSKNSYSWPTLTFVPGICQDYLPSSFKNKYGTNEGIASLSIALIDTFIQTPLERIRILQTIKHKEFQTGQLRKIQFSQLYKGSFLTFQQSFLNIFSFLMLEKFFRAKTKEFTTPDLPWSHFCFIGFTLSLIQTTITHPFMTARVRVQSSLFHEPTHHTKSTREIFKQILREGGIRHLYGGWVVRFVRSALTITLDSYFLDCIDQHKK